MFHTLGFCERHRQLHQIEPRLQCPNCSNRFLTYTQLNRHKRIHVAEWCSVCHVCSAVFATKHELLRHMRSHKHLTAT